MSAVLPTCPCGFTPISCEGWRRALTLTVVLALTFGSAPLWAAKADFAEIETFSPSTVNLGIWAVGDGTQVWTHLNCVGSADFNNTGNIPPPAQRMLYRYRLIDRNSPTGYFLYLDNDDSNTGNARISVQAEHRDVKEPTSWQALADDVYDTHSHLGQFNDCPAGDNNELRLTIQDVALQGARAGDYVGLFRAQITGGSSGNATDQVNLRFRLEVAELVRVSSLENISLGTWDGVNNMVGTATFCVYSNNDNAAYDVTFTSPNTSGGSFRLANFGASAFVPYSLQFNDVVNAGPGTTVTPGNDEPGNGNNGDLTCNAVDNSRITVTVSALDLAPLTPEAFADTLTLMVAPR